MNPGIFILINLLISYDVLFYKNFSFLIKKLIASELKLNLKSLSDLYKLFSRDEVLPKVKMGMSDSTLCGASVFKGTFLVTFNMKYDFNGNFF